MLQAVLELLFDNDYNQLLVIFADANTRNDVEIQTTQLVKDLEEAGYQVFSAPVPVPDKYAFQTSTVPDELPKSASSAVAAAQLFLEGQAWIL